MGRVARLAGAILAASRGELYLVGNPKQPCDFAACGLQPPDAIDARARPFIPLHALGPVRDELLAPPLLVLPLEGRALAELCAQRLLIERTGSVSERLWRLVMGVPEEELEPAPDSVVEARWLAELPGPIWQIVRDSVLRCS